MTKRTNRGAIELLLDFLYLGIYYLTANPHWARVVGYGPFAVCVIHTEGLCSSSEGINRLMMMIIKCIRKTGALAVGIL
jgi:hypothetical protein